MKRRSIFGLKEKILASILAVLVLAIILFSIVLVRSTRPFNQARQEAEALALQYGKISEPDAFYYYNRSGEYYGVKGKSTSGEMTYALIPQDGKEITILKEKDGTSDNQAMKIALATGNVVTITKVSLGKKDDQVVWEITGKDQNKQLVYFLIQFTDGQVLSEIQNI